MPMNGERAYQLMKESDVDVIVASSTENVYYISDYWSLGKKLGCGVEAYAILPIEADPALITPLGEADLIVDSQTWINDLRFYGESGLELSEANDPPEQTEALLKIYREAKPEADGVSALLKSIEDKDLQKSKIALDSSGMDPREYEYVKEKLPDSEITDGAEILRKIRLVKTPPEVERIRRATEITEKSMEDALEIARSEITELDLSGMFAYSVAYDGGQVTQNMIGIGERSAYPNPVPSIFAAKRRNLIRMTLGCTWDHYHSNISRTAVIARPQAKAQRRWEAVQRSQDAALDLVKPGVKVSEICAAVEKEFKSAEIEGLRTPVGHCLGVQCNEEPVIQKGADGELIEGMVLNIDIPLLELGWGGVQLEDTVLVTSDSFELLTRTDRTLYLL